VSLDDYGEAKVNAPPTNGGEIECGPYVAPDSHRRGDYLPWRLVRLVFYREPWQSPNGSQWTLEYLDRKRSAPSGWYRPGTLSQYEVAVLAVYMTRYGEHDRYTDERG
jgi:hypothetical protein